MASVTVYSVAKMEALLDTGVVGGAITGGRLILQTRGGSTVDAGPAVASLPDANDTAKGVVELATDVETTTGTDNARAVTPFGLAALTSSATRRGLVELATDAEAITGTDTTRALTPKNLLATKIIGDPGEAALPSAYPLGMSAFKVSNSAWSLNSGSGSIHTTNEDGGTAQQIFRANFGGTQIPRIWFRDYHSSNGGGGWTAWTEAMVMGALAAASFTQTTAFTSYPLGTSRLYYTTANSSSWDFTGKAGEVLTYREGTDFAKQQWTKHVGGTAAGVETEIWVRTATAANGWSRWRIIADDQADTGWLALSMTGGASYTVAKNLRYRRKDGIVYLDGSVVAPSGGFTTFASLPAGFKPPLDRKFAVSSNTTVSMAGQIVASSGAIQSWLSAASAAWFPIDGVCFPVD